MNQSFFYKTEAVGILANIRKLAYFHDYLKRVTMPHFI